MDFKEGEQFEKREYTEEQEVVRDEAYKKEAELAINSAQVMVADWVRNALEAKKRKQFEIAETEETPTKKQYVEVHPMLQGRLDLLRKIAEEQSEDQDAA